MKNFKKWFMETSTADVATFVMPLFKMDRKKKLEKNKKKKYN